MEMNSRKIVACAFLGGWLAVAGLPAAPQEPPLKKGFAGKAHVAVLMDRIPRLMAAAGVPGMSIALVSGGKVAWSHGFGVRNRNTGEPVDERTVFEAASLTKPFFACLVMMLAEEGKLDLDKPLVSYAPQDYIAASFLGHPLDQEGFRLDRFARITARMVLSHSSGLPHGGPRKPMPILFEPGEKFRYSAEGYEYLQRIVEHLCGQPLDRTMRERLIEPLGMKDSTMVWRDDLASRAATGHDALALPKDGFNKRTHPHAAASLYTTAADYGRFVAALLGNRILKKQARANMLSPVIAVQDEVDWGIGFGLQETGNGEAFWQWGDDLVYRDYIVAYAGKGIAVVYLTNSQNGLAIGQDILDMTIGGGRDRGLAFLNYERWDSPAGRLLQAVRDQGVAATVRRLRDRRPGTTQSLQERDINALGYALMNAGRGQEAIEVFQVNAETFPQSANSWDSLAEAVMAAGDSARSLELYRRVITAAAGDPRGDKAFLESLVKGAQEKIERLEKRLRRQLVSEEAEKLYSRFCGDFRFDVPGMGVMEIRVFIANGLLWAKAESGTQGGPAEFIPIEGRPLEFQLDSPSLGTFAWEFIADGKGAISGARFFHPQMNIRAEGVKK